MILVALTALTGLAGCAVGVGYDDGGPGWDGQVIVVGGYDRGYHNQVFHAERGGHGESERSSRGRASLGPRAGGGGGGRGGHK